MKLLDPIVKKIYLLDSKEKKKLILIVAVSLLMVCIGINFLYYIKCRNHALEAQKINKQRAKVKSLLNQKAYIDSKKETIKGYIAKEPTFRIKEYCLQIIGKLGLEKFFFKGLESINETEASEEYTELYTMISFKMLDMQSMLNFLYELGLNKRLYIKEMKINQSNKKNAVDCSIVVATLKPKSPVGS